MASLPLIPQRRGARHTEQGGLLWEDVADFPAHLSVGILGLEERGTEGKRCGSSVHGEGRPPGSQGLAWAGAHVGAEGHSECHPSPQG